VFPKSIRHKDSDGYNKRYDFAGKKALLAEDNETNQEIAVMLLNDVGLFVDCVENGEEAVTKFNMSSPGEYDVVLMDIQMPVMDGHRAARKIRKLNRSDAKSVPIIAMTANAFVEDVALAKESGMDGHISKPIDVDVLYSTIKSFIMI
jgi:CheY-like chemotaxis protein